MDPIDITREELLELPALLPPKGVEPNFIDPSSMQDEFNYVITLSLAIAALSVMIRLYTRKFIVRNLALDDYTLLVALAAFIGYCAVALVGNSSVRFGVHQWNTKLKNAIHNFYISYLCYILFCVVVLILKTSIIQQCLRVFAPTGVRNLTYWTLLTILLAQFALYIPIIIIDIFLCNPRAKAWDPTVKGKCMNINMNTSYATGINAASDFLLFVIPQIIIWNLNMPTMKKWAISSVFWVGILCTVLSLIRLYYSLKLFHSKDLTHLIALMGIWSFPELACGFLAASLPVFPKFIRHILNNSFVQIFGSRIHNIFQIRRSAHLDHLADKDQVANPSDQSPEKKNIVITDIEYEELVIRTEQISTVSSNRGCPNEFEYNANRTVHLNV